MNFDPKGMFVPSAIVTSCRSIAPSLQLALALPVGKGVPGVLVGVRLGAAVLVAGSVAVTNDGVELAGVGVEIETQADATSATLTKVGTNLLIFGCRDS